MVVYKIDRLSRSLMDFSKLVEVFDRQGVTFVSVTQSFNTTTSMGRLTLNILLCFAQFEREVIAERVRDKIRASRQKGMWMGGSVPLGYVVQNRKLVVHEPDATVVRSMFERFLRVGSATLLAQELRAEGVLTTKGRPIDKGYLYKCLSNRTYLGLAIHKGTAYPGEHAAIIPQDLWDKVHAILAENGRTRSSRTRAQTPALLKGLLFGPTGAAMSPTHTRKGNRLYRYYVSQDVLQHGPGACPIGRVPAAEIEARGHRPAARRVPAAGDHRRHLARRAERAGRHHRGRGARGSPAARSAVGRALPRRAGADRAAAGRAGRRGDRRHPRSLAHQRARRTGARSRRHRPKGRSMSAEHRLTAGRHSDPPRSWRTSGSTSAGCSAGRAQPPSLMRAQYRVLIDVQPNGAFTVYSDADVQVLCRCAHLPEDQLVQVHTRPIPEAWLDEPIGHSGDGSVADLLAEVVADWPDLR